MVVNTCNTAHCLFSQYESVWKMTRSAIENIPDENWTYSVGKWFYPLTLYHIIETMDFYRRDEHESMVWGQRASIKWDNVKNVDKDVLPLLTKDLVSDYLTEVQQKITTFMQSVKEENLFQKDGFHWFENVYQKLLYLLRHTQHHLGEIAISLRQMNAKPLEWT